ncbi:SDR family NAD(P)-dependent oxidoreductase [Sphingomonas lenta]|uniref:SDR family NAD(P)-dependent oxidoreductase n=1 Tax=Sphingomonas lenta TaxID=1141887 RepID=UPI001C3E8FC5|nr:SDR family NAD(P)-dependent oxidoreductase [Sphingomonas lenta]
MRRLGLALVLSCAGLSACAADTTLRRADGPRIAGRTYVITGASSGFGRGAAVRAGSLGANVVLAARRGELLEEVANEIRGAGGQAIAVPTDVADPQAVERLAQAAEARFGRIDVWINNAGVLSIGEFTAVPLADHTRTIDVNLKGVIHGAHAAMRRFVAQGYGTLVNVGSVESVVPLPYHGSYVASKYGILGLGRALNEEMRLKKLNKRIRVSTVMPFAADTPIWQHAGNYTGRVPRMIMMDAAQPVADAIVWASVHPKEELPVGWKAQGAVSAHNIFPDLTEVVAANIYHDTTMRDAPPGAPPNSGNVHRPEEEGRGVSGGNRERIRAEDRAREAAEPR